MSVVMHLVHVSIGKACGLNVLVTDCSILQLLAEDRTHISDNSHC